MRYIKGTQIISSGDSIVLNGFRFFNPRHQDYLDAGYQVYIEPEKTSTETITAPSNYEAVYKQKVEEYIREEYSLSDEIALLRQQEDKQTEYTNYYNYCEVCKLKARQYVKDLEEEESKLLSA